MAKTSTCKHCGKPIIFEPYFIDGKPGPNPPIWFHPPGVITCWPMREVAEPAEDAPPAPTERNTQ